MEKELENIKEAVTSIESAVKGIAPITCPIAKQTDEINKRIAKLEKRIKTRGSVYIGLAIQFLYPIIVVIIALMCYIFFGR